MSDLHFKFGEMVHAARINLGESQHKFAAQIGISQASLSRIERGDQHTTLLLAIRIANKLKLSFEKLIKEGA